MGRLAARFLVSLAAVAAGGSVVRGAPAPRPAIQLQEFVEPAPLNPEVHASTLVEASPGVFVAAWFSGSKEGNDDVTIWAARRTGAGWSPAREIARGRADDGSPRPCYNPVLFHAGDRLALIYSIGRPREAWTPYGCTSTDGGQSWSAPARLPDGMRGPDRNRPLRLTTGELLHPSTGGAAGEHRVVHVEFSDLALQTWRRGAPLADPRGLGAIQPTLLDHGAGRLQMLCRTYARELATAWSDDNGRTWSPLEGLEVFMANSAIDATRLRDGRFLLVYNPTARPADSRRWGERVPLSVAVSDDGRTWRHVLDLETAAIREGYAYPCVLVASDGRVHVTYTWGRKRIRHVILDPSAL